MKKIFTFLCLLMLGVNMSVEAQNPKQIYDDLIYCRLIYSSGTTFEVKIFDSDGYCDVYFTNVDMGSTNSIVGWHRVPQKANTYVYTYDENQYSNPYGVIGFEYTGRSAMVNSTSCPVYKITVFCRDWYSSYNGDFYLIEKDLPVICNDVTLNNTAASISTEINIPGCNGYNVYGSDYIDFEGQNESWFNHFETAGTVNSSNYYYTADNEFDLTSSTKTCLQSLPGGTQNAPSLGSAHINVSNSFYFFDGYYEVSGNRYHVTMQSPNYQAVNTSYSATFDWEDVTLTKKNDNTITLTAQNATSQKKTVIDFIVSGEIDNDDPVIPAGSYTIGISGGAGTVIASKGINRDLSVNSSYAGSTTAVTAANCSSNPLWCFRTGTVTVGDDKSVTVVANQSYRGSPVNITINGPVLEGSYSVSTGVNPSGAGYITGTVGEAAFAAGTYDAGTSITLTAHNNAGWRFDKWNNNATANPFTFTLSKDTSLTAQFIKTYVVTVNDDGRGTVTGGNTYDVNEVAQLSATSNNEHLYFFQKWQKLNGETYEDFDGNTANPINITVTSDATYKAIFRQASNGTIAANASPVAGGYVVVNQSSTAGGTAVTLTVNENDGYAFTGWADGGNDNPRIVYVDGDYEYTAQFVEGVEIVVLDGTCNDESGYFNFLGSVNGYDVRIESASVALRTGDFSASQLEQTNNYTYVKKNSTHVTLDYSRQSANVSILDHTHLLMEAWEYDTSGKPYHISIKAPLPNSKEINSRNSAYNVESFPSVDEVTAADEEGKAWIYANKGGSPGTGYYVYNTWLAFMPDNTKYGKIPSGTYPIKGTEEVGTAVGGYNLQLNGSGYLSSMDGCVAQRRNGYVENIWIPVDGTIEVINVDETYYVNVLGKSSYKQNVYFTMGTAPYNVNITSDANGSVDIALNASNWGTTVHYDEGVNKFFNGNALTLTATATTENYEFWRWSDEDESVETSAYGSSRNVTVSGNLTLQAIFREAAATYTVTIVSNNTDYGTVSHASVTNVPYGTVITTNDNTISVNGTTVTATAKEFYSFVEWQNIPGTLSDDVELTAVFALPETIVLRDDFENGSQWQDDYADLLDTLRTGSDKAGKSKQKNVQLNRTFAAERWSTFALPFGYSLSSNQTHPFYGHVYSLVSAKYEQRGGDVYLTLNCVPNTTSIKANTPYVLITDKDAPIANPVFNNVRLTEIEENTTTVVQDVNNTGSVRFVNTLYRQRIDTAGMGGVDALNKRVIFLQGNHLHYPNDAVWMNAFRGYFYMDYSTIYHVQPRVRLVMPDGESIEQAPDTDQPATVETKKYIENGILVIERAGMKYDAQGHIIK